MITNKTIPRAVIFLVATLFALSCSAYAQQPEVGGQKPEVGTQHSALSTQHSIAIKEALPDGEYIVVINGAEQRTITESHAQAINKRNEDFDRLQRTRAVLEKQIAIYEDNLTAFRQVVKIADEQRGEEAGIEANYKSLFEGEHSLRLQAEKLYAPPGKIARLLDNQYVRIGTQIAVPALQSWLTARRQ